VNEALSYHEFVKGQLRQGASAVPAHLICDRSFLWRYGLGKVKPFTRSLAADLASGYLKTGASLGELARSIGVPPDALHATVRAFNADARRGVDQAFGRGGDIYQRHLGDGDQRPNPCVAPIEEPPFFAVRVEPADLGMAAGLITDASARVLDPQGNPIPGLYACGNDMQSVMNGAYPGPGITLGPALVFGYLAARHAAGQLMR
jgi:succinate dehydrogenase/fumarate reductase flavoprotein subunit